MTLQSIVHTAVRTMHHALPHRLHRRLKRRFLLAAPVLVAASVVCGAVPSIGWAQGQPESRPSTPPASAQPDRARAVLQLLPLGRGESEAERTVAVRIVGEGRTVASYQAVLTFNKDAIDIVRSGTPSDGYRIMNMADTAQSRLRIAGFATNGFSHDTVVTLRVRRRGPEATLTMRLEVVGDPLGKPFAATAMSPATLKLPALPRK